MLSGKNSVLFGIVALLALSVLSGLPDPVLASHSGGPGESQVHGIPVGPGLYRLHGTDPELPYDDLEPLHFIVGNATFVGLGESVHTNGGFSEMKHRVFRFLVEEMRFRAFGFETPWVEAELAREYVETCQVSSTDALGSLFAVWESSETLALLEWMCEWNQEHPNDPVHFYGFDIQNPDDQNLGPLLAFLERLGYGEGDPLVEGIQACDGAEVSYFPVSPYPEELYEQCQTALSAASDLFIENRRKIIRATSKDDLAWAQIHLVSAQSWQEEIFFIDLDFFRSYAARDRGMAFVATAMRDLLFPRARTALWAHNGHVIKNGPVASNGLTTMGTFLDETLGRSYVSLALSAFETYVEWPWIGFCGGPYYLFDANPVEVPLKDTGEAALLVDFDPRGHHPAFFTPDTVYSIGGIGGIPAEHFDGMIYLEVARAMDPLFNFPPCP